MNRRSYNYVKTPVTLIIGSCLKFALCMVVLGVAGTAQSQLVNGNFETGDFTGWVLFNTPNGSLGDAQVVQFDTAGTGTPSFSAQFEVGLTGGYAPQQGGGILQYVTLGSGQLTINLGIAALNVGVVNADGGTFELLLDGTVVDSYAFGEIGIAGPFGSLPQTNYSTLSYSGTVEAGTHEIAIEMDRDWLNRAGDTPYQYLDNVVLEGSAIPEPSAIVLATIGLAAVAVRTRRR
jgi:hypothetical protein